MVYGSSEFNDFLHEGAQPPNTNPGALKLLMYFQQNAFLIRLWIIWQRSQIAEQKIIGEIFSTSYFTHKRFQFI